MSILLAVTTVLLIAIKRTYEQLPSKELKRRARAGDNIANSLYKVVAYGPSASALLTGLVVLSAAGLFVAVANQAEPWFAVFVVALITWFGFLWLPRQEVDRISSFLAQTVAPAFAWLLRYIHPLLSRTNDFIRKYRPIRIHTGLYQKEDLLDLLNQQQVQADNHIDQGELAIVQNVLVFGEKTITEVLTPRKVVKMVASNEAIGPLLMSELHDSGYSRFPVFEEHEDNIVGVLMLRDLVSAKEGGTVEKYIQKDLHYIHQDQSLYSALAAILKTQNHMFIVVNSFEEYVGVVTIEDILEQVLGQDIVDEFDKYDDMRAVAAMMAEKEHKKHSHPVDADEPKDATKQ